MSNFQPRDLLNKEVAGICGVARMTDKARAAHTGNIGTCKYGANSEQDTAILSFLGISAEAFHDAAVQIENDIRLGAWILDNCEVSDSGITEFNGEFSSKWKSKMQPSSFSRRRRELYDSDDPPFPWWMAPGWWVFWKIFRRR